MFRGLLPLLSLLTLTAAHEGNAHLPNPVKEPDESWALWHLRSEHHLSNFDTGAFFYLHDFDANGFWSKEEVLRTYGLMQEDVSQTSAETIAAKERVWSTISGLMDHSGDGEISLQEWSRFCDEKGEAGLPDMGTGPGHHGDDEYEYEIHHFEYYHGDDATEEELVHEEDIAHFRKHDQEDAEAARQAVLEMSAVNMGNIPQKFRVPR